MVNICKKIFPAILIVLLIAGCGGNVSKKCGTSIIENSYAAADALVENLPHDINTETPLLVTSFVNIDNLEQSSTLGRNIAELIASRLVQRGFTVKEVRLSSEALVVKKEAGEFALSRNLADIRSTFDVNHVIVGTYSHLGSYMADKNYLKGNRKRSSRCVTVSSRLVRINDNNVISAYDFIQPCSIVY